MRSGPGGGVIEHARSLPTDADSDATQPPRGWHEGYGSCDWLLIWTECPPSGPRLEDAPMITTTRQKHGG